VEVEGIDVLVVDNQEVLEEVNQIVNQELQGQGIHHQLVHLKEMTEEIQLMDQVVEELQQLEEVKVEHPHMVV
jgi:NADH:ubiquinone oxidoreductase subunit D